MQPSLTRATAKAREVVVSAIFVLITLVIVFTRCNFTRRNWPEKLLTPRHKYFGYFTFHCVSAIKMVRTVTIGLSSAMHLALNGILNTLKGI